MELISGLVAAALGVLSMIACAGVAILWVRSYWVGDVFERRTDAMSAPAVYSNNVLRAVSARGAVAFTSTRRDAQIASPRMTLDQQTNTERLEEWPPRPFCFVRNVHSTMEPERINLLRKTWLQKLGFNFRGTRHSNATRGGAESLSDWTLRVPHWALVLITAAPAARLVRVYGTRRRRWKRGLCRECGYDLRASEDRCPECGTSLRTATTSS